MTDEIKTVLSTMFTPSHSPFLQPLFPQLLLLSRCFQPAAAVTSPQWFHIFALASNSSAVIIKASYMMPSITEHTPIEVSRILL